MPQDDRCRELTVCVCLPCVLAYRPDVWTALGDPTRKAIFELLVDRPRAVVELAGELPVSRPAVSQHLRVLKNAGLVADEPAPDQGAGPVRHRQ